MIFLATGHKQHRTVNLKRKKKNEGAIFFGFLLGGNIWTVLKGRKTLWAGGSRGMEKHRTSHRPKQLGLAGQSTEKEGVMQRKNSTNLHSIVISHWCTKQTNKKAPQNRAYRLGEYKRKYEHKLYFFFDISLFSTFPHLS